VTGDGAPVDGYSSRGKLNEVDGIAFDYSLSAYNKGAAWSMFSGYTIVLAIISIVFVIFAVVFDSKSKFKKNKLYDIAFALILSGAFGNAIDRTFLGYVRDFIKLDFVNFPIFNVADSLLCIGVLLLAIFILTYKNDKQSKVAEINKA